MNKLQIFKERLLGKSAYQLALDFKTDVLSIEKAVSEILEEIRGTCKLTAKQRLSFELERYDRWTEVLEKELKNNCEDVIDPETGKVFRDGNRCKNLTIANLLRISIERSKLLKLTSLEEDVKTEAQQLFESIKDIDLDGLETIEDILEYNKKLQSL